VQQRESDVQIVDDSFVPVMIGTRMQRMPKALEKGKLILNLLCTLQILLRVNLLLLGTPPSTSMAH
jgi:hypothetical protein